MNHDLIILKLHWAKKEPTPSNTPIGKKPFWVLLDENQMNIDWVLGQFRKKKSGSKLFFSPFSSHLFFSSHFYHSLLLGILLSTPLFIKSPSFLPIDPYLLTYLLTYIHVFANNVSAFQPWHCFTTPTIDDEL
jgi:hypothetical protein